MPTAYKTPGVYVNEINAFSNSVVPVETAVPAFIGYTPEAAYNGKSFLNKAVKIESYPQFLAYFALRNPDDPTGQTYADESLQYQPIYYPVELKEKENPATAALTIGGKAYHLEPDPNSVYNLYNSIKLFYANGGSTCFVVSVGLTSKGKKKGTPKAADERLLNANVDIEKLIEGLGVVAMEDEPTMIVVPDAVLLKEADNQRLNQAILQQCGKLMSRVGLFDIQEGDDPDPNHRDEIIKKFRGAIGMNDLSYGIAYYPFLETSVMSDSLVDFRNVGGGPQKLASVLPKLDGANAAALAGLIAKTEKSEGPQAVQVENALRSLSADYARLHDALLAKMNILPPSAAMAGAYTMVDTNEGVWKAPANLTLNSVTDTTLKISDKDQEGLNVDAVAGKSINAIRNFPGKGVTVWGARTLDGNSDDWRYVNVRRTLIFIEQSMKLAANAYVFDPNSANTWSLVSSMLKNFLTNLWTQGALEGATPAEAFSVSVGLGLTMTPQDILDGKMIISVKVAVSHPAEFIIINIQQQMQTS